MGNPFKSARKPQPDPELERIKAENAARAAKEKADLQKKEEEEKAAVQRRLRGSRALFSRGQRGFNEDENDVLGAA